MIVRTPTDIVPSINIPVIPVAWAYTGLNREDVEARLTTPYEKALTTFVDNIQYIESSSYNGRLELMEERPEETMEALIAF
jgi:multidrug efflux pump subunit AcrB